MSWIQTYTGKKFFPLNPRVEDIDILDIAHALSLMCRYGGHCSHFYSVGEHSVILSRVVPKEDALWALLHDATEAYLVDVPRPVKKELTNYREIEAGLEVAIAMKFGLGLPMPEAVKHADNSILTDEMHALMPNPPDRWDNELPALGVWFPLWDPPHAEAAFLKRFNELTGVN